MLGRNSRSNCLMTNSTVGVAVAAIGIDVGWSAADVGKGADGRDWVLLDYTRTADRLTSARMEQTHEPWMASWIRWYCHPSCQSSWGLGRATKSSDRHPR